MEGIITAIEFS